MRPSRGRETGTASGGSSAGSAPSGRSCRRRSIRGLSGSLTPRDSAPPAARCSRPAATPRSSCAPCWGRWPPAGPSRWPTWLMSQQPPAASLAAYGGWNTAGNTLGTVLAQAVIRAIALRAGPTREQRAAHLEFLFLRFLDDDLYQGRERTRCMVEDLPAAGISPTMERLPDGAAAGSEGRVEAHLCGAAAGLRNLFVSSRLVRDVRVDHVHLPWRRLFEVGFDVQVELD